MKGDGFIKKIRLTFIGAPYNSNNKVYIYDLNNRLIYKGYLNNVSIYFKAIVNSFYRVKCCINNEEINRVFYISRNICNINIVLSNILIDISNIVNPDTITFFLTDLNYDNLPIEKGEMILWQN